MVKNGFLHCHTMFSLFDSAVTPDELVKRAKELGAENITLTDHGTLLGIEPFMDAGAKYKINTIPGVELYLKHREHFILFAKNYKGYQAISKTMRNADYQPAKKSKKNKDSEEGSQRYYACVPDDVLLQLKGNENIVATTACMQGPIAKILLYNFRIRKKINKIENAKKEIHPMYLDYRESDDIIKNLLVKKENLKNEEKTNKKNTSSAQAKKIRKLKKEIDSGQVSLFYDQQLREYTDKKNFYDYCVLRLKKIKEELSDIDNQIKEHRKIKKNLKSKYDRYIELDDRISSMSTQLLSEESLLQKAKDMVLYYADVFPNFYIELQYHGIEEEAYIMPLLASIARSLAIPVIAGNDAHMVDNTEDSLLARQIMRFNYFERHQELGEADKELYLKSDEELTVALRKILDKDIVQQAIDNLSILSECRVVMETKEHYPKIKDGPSFDELLEDARKKKIKQGKWNDVYEKRLRHEMKVIKEMGYVDYHLVVRDFCNAARKLGTIPKNQIQYCPSDFNDAIAWVKAKGFRTGIGVGPGRGSAGGSLVCYLLGITNIDPVKYNLLFERFLNPERVSMPDIDTDVKTSLRPLIIRYLKWKFGEKAVCSIATETKYKAKGAIKAAGRDRASELCMHLPKKEYISAVSDYMNKFVYPIIDAMDDNDSLNTNRAYEDGTEEAIIWRRAKLIENKLFATGLHAGGVVISDNDDINEYIPLAWNEENQVWAAQCDMVKLETRGMIKMDLLGLSTLDIVSDCLQLIEQRTGRIINPDEIPFEPIVFREIYAKGKTNSVFQFESPGMKKMLKDFKPESIEDVILLVAAYRPGPMQFIPDIIDVKNGRKKPSYVVPELKDILDSTYGYPVYQEQLMSIFHVCAGFSLGKADIVRRYMSKKKVENFLEFKPEFVTGLMNTGATEKGAIELWDSLTDFAKYAFNRSHAAAYAIVSYQTAWLKYHYPTEFFCAMFNNKEQKKFTPIMDDCKDFHVNILPVDINHSQYEFSIEDAGIRFGFKGIKGIGDSNLLKDSTRGYHSFKDFVLKDMLIEDNGKITQMKSSVVENLINSGAFDKIYKNRERLLEHYSVISDIIKRATDLKALTYAINHYEMTDILSRDEYYNIQKENELLGSIISIHPLDGYMNDKFYKCTPYSELTSGNVKIMGFVVEQKKKFSKKGNLMQVYSIEGFSGKLSAVQMGDALSYVGKVVIIAGSYQKDTLFVRSISCLSKGLTTGTYIIKTLEDNYRIKEIYKNDTGDKNHLLHIINYATKDGCVAQIPAMGDLHISEQAFNVIKEKSPK